MKKYLILFLILNPALAFAQSTGPVGPVGPSVGTTEEETSPTNKPSVDLPYKPSAPKSDKSKKSSDGEAPLDSPRSQEIPYILSQSPESVGAKDPSY